jgi:hypothetical protein
VLYFGNGVWINGTKVADAHGLCADKAARPGVVLRAFEACRRRRRGSGNISG